MKFVTDPTPTAQGKMMRTLLLIAPWILGCGAKTALSDYETRETAVSIPSTAIAAITVGDAHACALRAGGEVWCWGRNDKGQLGDDSFVDRGDPVKVVELAGVVQISAGRNHTCARLSDRSLRCWGHRLLGQLGDGAPLIGATVFMVPKPVFVANIDEASFVSAGEAHTCAITGGGTMCFGSNDFGELGNGRTQRSSTATGVLNVSDAKQLALGAAHACALIGDGSVRCWGSNEAGQLGGAGTERCGSYDCARSAVLARVEEPATAIAAAANRSCALLASGAVSCFGALTNGVEFMPQIVPGLSDVAEIALGQSHSCVRRSEGSVWCWGEGDRGQLGYVVDDPCPRGSGHCSLTPTRIALGPVRALALGGDTSCALLVDSSVQCWGRVGKTETVAPVRIHF